MTPCTAPFNITSRRQEGAVKGGGDKRLVQRPEGRRVVCVAKAEKGEASGSPYSSTVRRSQYKLKFAALISLRLISLRFKNWEVLIIPVIKIPAWHA